MLQDAVGEGDVDGGVAERQVARVASDEVRSNAELFGDAAGGADGAEGGIDADRDVAGACGGEGPAAPVAPGIEQRAAVAGTRRYAHLRDRVGLEPAHQ